MGKFKNLEDAQAAFDASEKESIQKDEVIAELRAQLTVVKKAKSSNKLVVEHNKKKYAVEVMTFNYNKTEYQASDLLENKELLTDLIEKKVGFLTEV